MTSPDFDLQSHSQHSDGALAPAAVVGLAAQAGVRRLALTDHDSVGGVDEAIAAGEACGVAVVPAAELSAIHDEHEDLHILGYGIDHHRPQLLDALRAFRADRDARARRMAGALEELGFTLDHDALSARAREGGSVGRPHLARAVFRDTRNEEGLRREGLDTAEKVLEAYLLPGGPAYRGRTFPRVEEAIDLIHGSGGLAVWAHPYWNVSDDEEVLATARRFIDWGIDGLESFYLTHDRAQTELLDDLCRSAGLLSTGSSDFHGPEHPLFSRFLAFSLHGRSPRLGEIGSADQLS